MIACPQAVPGDWAKLFPCPPERLPEIIQVVFLAPASSKDEIARLAEDARALHVNGRNIVAWAQHLAEHYQQCVPGAQLCHDSLRAYEQLDGVPDELIANAIVARDDEEADELLQVIDIAVTIVMHHG